MKYAFDSYTLDTSLYQLCHNGAPVAVEPQVFELLTLLLEAHDRVVSRSEIIDIVWKGRIVSEAAISSRIRDARKAIGDSGASQRLIRTLSRRGFQFLGDVRKIDESTGTPETPAREVDPAEVETFASDILLRPAIAVLPFEEVGGRTDASYLADGLTDEVTAALCSWRCFPVISRNTAFRYRGSALSAPEIGRATGARYLLSGTLHVGADRVKLMASLVDAEDDRQMWSGRIQRPIEEMQWLEEELAGQVVQMLEPEMRGAEIRRILRKAPEDMTAWDLAMRAMWRARRAEEVDYAEAERLASEAAARAPDWSLPYGILAFVKFQRAMRSFSASDARTAFAETLQAARKALEIDSSYWLAHALVGVGELWTNLHYDLALNHIHRAIELNPSACQAYHFGGCITGFSGDPVTAKRHQRRIFQIDPAYPYTAVIEADLGLWSMITGDLKAAEEHLDRAVQWDAGYGRAYQRQVALYGLNGDRAGSSRALARLQDIGIPIVRDQLITSYPFREPAHRDLFFDGLRRAGLNL